MKRLTQLAGICLAICIAGPANAADLTPIPAVPGAVFGPTAGGHVLNGAVYVDAAPEPLFHLCAVCRQAGNAPMCRSQDYSGQ